MWNKPILVFLFFGLMVRAQEPQKYTQIIPGFSGEITMVPIPGGTLTMGSSPEDALSQSDEWPQRSIEVSGFWMSDSEITWELYKVYLNRTGQALPSSSLEGGASYKGNTVALDADAISGATIPYVDMSLGMGTGPGLPVGNVTRKAAALFCKWLSAKTGHFYRLPTEAEWEYAARAGSGMDYFFASESEELKEYAWYNANSDGTYHPVKQKKPNPWGLYDILGNVAEWTMDAYNPDGYPSDGADYVPAQSEYPGVLRGGHYNTGPEDLRLAARLASKPLWKQRDPQFPRSKWWFTDAPFAGFRIVRPFNPPPVNSFESYWDLP
jgi:formylglycine-generating enzyme required for sulfatase activity